MPGANQMVIVQLNAKLQPMDRGEYFEDPLDAILKPAGRGEVTGGGSMLESSGEIEYCDIELMLAATSGADIQFLIDTLEGLGAPKASKITVTDSGVERSFGKAEGLAVYLNGTDLPAAVYESCDVNVVFSEITGLLDTEGRILSHWQGPTETALYIYGGSFAGMNARIEGFLASYPMCQKCRVAQIA